MYNCPSKKTHDYNEWCGLKLSQSKYDQIKTFLDEIAGNCCIPHGSSWASASECPSCLAKDLLRSLDGWASIGS